MRLPEIGRLLVTALLGLLSATTLWAEDRNPERLEFNRDIRPILSNACFVCHGPDANTREAGLRLDKRDVAIAETESGAVAIVPGKSDESELIARITSTEPDVKMPPASSQHQLSAEQIDRLRRWIDEGAEYQGHWSFLPIQRPAPPELGESTPVPSPIDHFVLARLNAQQLTLSPPADPAILARRVAFDLTGLPPTPEQVARLVADPSDASYEKLVDELLASARYGERMAMWWLDLVRYADSVGYHGDQEVSVYPFRQWVIEKFNRNQPFDQFTREQLGGDLLPEPTLEQKVASGYNRLGMMSAEGGAQPKEYLLKYAAERVRNVGGTWLGLTTGCCECHDHKFDPLTAKDFYQLSAFFSDLEERGLYDGGNFGPSMTVPSPEQAADQQRLSGELAKLRASLDEQTTALAAEQAKWEQSFTWPEPPQWLPQRPVNIRSHVGATLEVQEDQAVLASGTSPAHDTYTVTFSNVPPAVTALQLEVLPHASLPGNGPGRASNGNFVLSEIVLKVLAADGTATEVPLARAHATFEQNSFPVSHAIDKKHDGGEGWAVLPHTGKAITATFELAESLSVPEGGSLVVELIHSSPHVQHCIGQFRISLTSSMRDSLPTAEPKLPRGVIDALKTAADQRSDAQRQELQRYFQSITPPLAQLQQQIAGTEQAIRNLESTFPKMLATRTVEPRVVRVLPRGNWMDESGEVVMPGVPGFLPQPPAKEGRLTRLDLADWLVSAENPLTARTLVNRLWKLCFGEGLSRKVDDLGAQGESPSHPELLDWLAADLRDNGWNIKRTMKQIVMSRTYRQTSVGSAPLVEKDPFNYLLARQGRFRLDAEMVRDNALWVSGLLVERVGGPSVRPYQPARYWAYLNFPEREWQNDKGENLYRRGLYVHWQRQYLHPSLLAFDAPSREECTAQRVRSNTPLQALVLLNDPIYVEAARVFAQQILHNGGKTPDEQLDYAFRRAVGRGVRPAEVEILLPLLEKHLAEFRAEPDAATALLAVGAYPRASDLDPARHAAWTSVARVLLNLHSTVTRN